MTEIVMMKAQVYKLSDIKLANSYPIATFLTTTTTAITTTTSTTSITAVKPNETNGDGVNIRHHHHHFLV